MRAHCLSVMWGSSTSPKWIVQEIITWCDRFIHLPEHFLTSVTYNPPPGSPTVAEAPQSLLSDITKATADDIRSLEPRKGPCFVWANLYFCFISQNTFNYNILVCFCVLLSEDILWFYCMCKRLHNKTIRLPVGYECPLEWWRIWLPMVYDRFPELGGACCSLPWWVLTMLYLWKGS